MLFGIRSVFVSFFYYLFIYLFNFLRKAEDLARTKGLSPAFFFLWNLIRMMSPARLSEIVICLILSIKQQSGSDLQFKFIFKNYRLNLKIKTTLCSNANQGVPCRVIEFMTLNLQETI